MEIVDIDGFNYYWLKHLPVEKRKRGNQGTRTRDKYVSIVTAFDIETTAIDEIDQAIMYIWQWQIGDKCTVIGRTWEELELFIERLKYGLKDKKLVTYVHNLSYEFQFLRGVFDFQPDDVFLLDNRKVCKATYQNVEFRCSYIHSNMSLKMFTEKMGAEHSKRSGEDFNYKIKRYPWTPLTDEELRYCQYDVLGLVEAITIEMKSDHDNLYTIPLTSTGYVRRLTKKAMDIVEHNFVKEQLPDAPLYTLLRQAFRGGDTHANRVYVERIIDNVKSVDRSSSYPDVICNCNFPIGPFFHKGEAELEEIKDLIFRREKAVVMRIALYSPHLRNPFYGSPYLSRDKCEKILDGVYDNGRILKARYLETSMTDIDLRILLDTYDFDDIIFQDVYYARYGKLPQPLIDLTIQFYRKKTELKKPNATWEEQLLYTKSKNLLNSIYGMMATDPVRPEIKYKYGEYVQEPIDLEKAIEESNKRAFLPYQWGVWTTAWARYRLFEAVKMASCQEDGSDGFIYCDTDSVKYIGNIDLTEYNAQRRRDSLASGAYATDPNGVTHFMGEFEDDGSYKQFSTMGAKKYVYIDDSGLHVTISGVVKSKGGKELEKHGGIKAFKQGFVFTEAGGTESLYNDDPPMDHYEIDGHTVRITKNILIKDSTYTLGITADYLRLLTTTKLTLDDYKILC